MDAVRLGALSIPVGIDTEAHATISEHIAASCCLELINFTPPTSLHHPLHLRMLHPGPRAMGCMKTWFSVGLQLLIEPDHEESCLPPLPTLLPAINGQTPCRKHGTTKSRMPGRQYSVFARRHFQSASFLWLAHITVFVACMIF